MVKKIKQKNKILLSIIISLMIISSTSVLAATKYWIGNGADLAIDESHLIFVDVSASRVGVGDPTPEYKLDVEGTGNLAYISSTSGIGVYAQGSTYGAYATASSTTGRGVYGYNSGSGGAAVYGLASSSSYSGWFTGGNGLFYNAGRVFNYASCAIESTASSNTETCAYGKEAVGGGCDCGCGSYRTIENRVTGGSLATPNGWYCHCADCTPVRTYAVCCGGA